MGRAVPLILLLLFAEPARAAFAYCSQPLAPSAYMRKPTKPICAISQDCSDLDVQLYKTELEGYFKKLKKYLGDVEDYYADAYDYAKCMANLD